MKCRVPTVLITRPEVQKSSLAQGLRGKGFKIFELPVIKILPPKNDRPLRLALGKCETFDWVVFSSVNAAESVLKVLRRLRKGAKVFGTVKIAAVGESTRRFLETNGFRPTLVPKKFSSAGLVKTLREKGEISGRRFLLPRSDIAPRDFPDRLRELGGQVTEVTAYRTVSNVGPKERRRLKEWVVRESLDFIVFTSASTVQHFFKAVPADRRKEIRSRLISIGPMTSEALRKHGYRPYREAAAHTSQGIIKVLSHVKK